MMMANEQQHAMEAEYELVAKSTKRSGLSRALMWLFTFSWLAMLSWLAALYLPAQDDATPQPQQHAPTPLVAEPAPPTIERNKTALVEEQAFAEQAIADRTTRTTAQPSLITTQPSISLNTLLILTLDIRNRLEQGLDASHTIHSVMLLAQDDVLLHDTAKELLAVVTQGVVPFDDLRARLAQLAIATSPEADSWWTPVQQTMSKVITTKTFNHDHHALVVAREAWNRHQLQRAIAALDELEQAGDDIGNWLIDAERYDQQQSLIEHLVERIVALVLASNEAETAPLVEVPSKQVTPAEIAPVEPVIVPTAPIIAPIPDAYVEQPPAGITP